MAYTRTILVHIKKEAFKTEKREGTNIRINNSP